MSSFVKLFLEAVLIVVLTVVLYNHAKKIDKHRAVNDKKWQLFIGCLYGLLAIGATEFGAPINGAIMNVRDAAPLIAGLFFGAPAGVIAGLLGGIERWLCVFWGGGEFTRWACSLGTFVAGLFGAYIKKKILEERAPGWLYALIIGAVAEVFHMLMVFLTNTGEVAMSMQVMYTCAPIMIPLVACTVSGPAFIIQAREGSFKKVEHEKRMIVQDIQALLLVSVLITFALTNGFEYITQKHLSLVTANNAIIQTLQDVESDVVETQSKTEYDLSDYLIADVKHRHIGITGFLNVFDEEGNLIGNTQGEKVTDSSGEKNLLKQVLKSDELTTVRSSSGGYERYQAYIKIGEYYVVGYYPATEAELGRDFSVLITAFLEVVILAVLFLQIYYLISTVVVSNLKKVTSGLSKISKGNLDTVVDVRSNAEFASLSNDINTTVGALKRYIREAAERIDAELKFAQDIQYSALPTVFPDVDEFDLYANMLAAKQVGGDFYDFYPVGDGKIAFMIADVSGKGVPAALFMMKAKTLIKSLVEAGHGPGTAFTLANEELCNGNSAEMFVTAWLGILDIDSRDVVYANAGHNNPIIGHCTTQSGEYLKTRHGMVLAGMEGVKYKEESIHLDEGDIIFLYTDGVTEATNANNELYGDDRLLKTFVDTNAMNMRYFCKVIKQDVDAFVGDAPQFDDITMLGIKMKSPDESRDKLELVPSNESIAELENFVEGFCESENLSSKTTRKLMVIVDEIYSNIVYYSGATKCSVSIVHRRGLVAICFRDDGTYYNPLEREDPDTGLDAEERAIGGLGIFMVKEMAEDIKYGRINGNNVLDIVLEG